jgi:hypothetical protein
VQGHPVAQSPSADPSRESEGLADAGLSILNELITEIDAIADRISSVLGLIS